MTSRNLSAFSAPLASSASFLRAAFVVTFLVFLAALAAPSVFAESTSPAFNVTLDAQTSTIYPDESAYYTLSITNLQNQTDGYIISTDDFDWIVDTLDVLGSIAPGQTQRTLLSVSPKTTVPVGVRLVRLKIRSANTREYRDLIAQVTIRSVGNEKQYAPSIFLSTKMTERVDPREPATLSIYLRNRNARDYPALKVRVVSDLFKREYTTTLGPVTGDEGEKTNQLAIDFNPATPPGTHSVRVELVADNTTVNSYEAAYTITAYESESRSQTADGAYFRTTTIYSVENTGNTERAITVEHPSSFVRRLFTSSSLSWTVDDAGAISFTVLLKPGERAEIPVTENFRLLVILGVIVVVSIISYFVFRSPVVLRKEAIIKGSSADGVSEMRIRLHVKNRSARAVHTLHVVDRITSMADIVKEVSLGTLQPSKVVKKPGHGTLVRWDLDTLDAFEERIISYTVRTKLKLIGDVYLPAVKAKFDQRGRERTSYSNEVNIPREG